MKVTYVDATRESLAPPFLVMGEDIALGKRGAVVSGLEEGEPVFVLRARDNIVPGVVRDWYRRAEPTLTDEHRERSRADLDAIGAWRAAHPELVRDPD